MNTASKDNGTASLDTVIKHRRTAFFEPQGERPGYGTCDDRCDLAISERSARQPRGLRETYVPPGASFGAVTEAKSDSATASLTMAQVAPSGHY